VFKQRTATFRKTLRDSVGQPNTLLYTLMVH